MRRERKHYDKEFKLMAINRCESGKPTREVAQELGIDRGMLYRWRRELEQFQEGSFSGHGNQNLSDEEKEIVRLKKELKEAQLESEILKKAIRIFSKKDGKYTNL